MPRVLYQRGTSGHLPALFFVVFDSRRKHGHLGWRQFLAARCTCSDVGYEPLQCPFPVFSPQLHLCPTLHLELVGVFHHRTRKCVCRQPGDRQKCAPFELIAATNPLVALFRQLWKVGVEEGLVGVAPALLTVSPKPEQGN